MVTTGLIVPYQIIENLARASIWWSRTKPLVLAWCACTLASTLFGATAYIGKNLRYSQLPIDLARDEDFAAYVDYYHARAFAPVAPILLATVAAALLALLIVRINHAQRARLHPTSAEGRTPTRRRPSPENAD